MPGIFGRVNDCALSTPPDGRRQPRTHLFVSAALHSDAGSAPVHIRNMSPSGALIEAPLLREPGSRIILRRGSLHAAGRIAWQVNCRAGVAFEGAVHVSDWMARVTGSGQDRVDEIVASFKAGSARPPVLTAPSDDGTGAPTIETELATVRADLVALSEGLIGDSIVAATHPEIQTLDITLQRIDRVLIKLRSG